MKRLIRIIFSFLGLVGMTGCSEPDFRHASGVVWGTQYHIVYQSPACLDDSIIAEMARVDASLSMFNPASTVSRINSGADSVTDAYVRDVWAVSEQVYGLSGGAFDPTVGPLVSLWGFGPRAQEYADPSQAAIDSVRALVGMDKWRLRENNLLRPLPGASIDFSAVAKGYGVDRVAAILDRNGVENYMVEVGGEIALAGHNPAGRPWRVQIDAPAAADSPGRAALEILDTTDCCMATSGNYRNRRASASGSDSYGHTIDPRQGRPVQRQWQSVTVIAPSCALADALATAIMCLPADSLGLLTPDSVTVLAY